MAKVSASPTVKAMASVATSSSVDLLVISLIVGASFTAVTVIEKLLSGYTAA